MQVALAAREAQVDEDVVFLAGGDAGDVCDAVRVFGGAGVGGAREVGGGRGGR